MKKGIATLICGVLLLSACTSSRIQKLSLGTGSLSLKQATVLSTTLVDSINDLTFKLQNEKDVSNVFSSGVSIYLALAMTAHGAAGETYRQFIDLLAPGMKDQKSWLEDLRQLQGNLNAVAPTRISLANSIWMRDSFAKEVKASFLFRNTDYFGAMIAALDFSETQSVQKINDWVKANTNGRINEALKSIDPATMMLLINTIYFKAVWQDEFKNKDTRTAIFHGKTDVTTKFMNRTGAYSYVDNDQYQAVLLPYSDGNTGMVVVLGKHETAPINDNETLKALLQGLKPKTIQLSLPKVSISTQEVLNSKLKSLGLVDAFTTADFSELSSANELYISKVLHKTKLIIDEKGTEAAAMTVVTLDKTSIMVPDITMMIDRPFQLFIVDLKNNLILFNGIIQQVSD